MSNIIVRENKVGDFPLCDTRLTIKLQEPRQCGTDKKKKDKLSNETQ